MNLLQNYDASELSISPSQSVEIAMNKFTRLFAAILLLAPCLVFSQNAEQQKRSIEIINRSSDRLVKGEIEALDDVKALPGDDAVKGLLLLFSNYHRVFKATEQQKAIAARAAQYFTECETAKTYVLRLFRKDPSRPQSPRLTRQRDIILDCLGAAKNRFSLKLMIELIVDSDLDVPPGTIGLGLARADIPGAPYSRSASKGTTTPEGLAKWKNWWSENQASFPE